MRTPRELASDALTSEAEHARRAAALRRLAGGIRSHSEGVMGLSAKERKILADAQAMLERMADTSKQAAVLAKKRLSDRAQREKAIRAAMAKTFAALGSAADQVALIGAVNDEVLAAAARNGNKLRDLGAEFKATLDDLTRTLAQRDSDKPPGELVAEAWGKFQRAKPGILVKHGAIVAAVAASSMTALQPRRR